MNSDLINFIKNSGNPQEFVLNMVEECSGNNPFMLNVLKLAKENKGNEIEKIVRNMFKEKGLDFDKEFNNFKRTMGL